MTVFSVNKTRRADECLCNNDIYIPGYEMVRIDRDHTDGTFGWGFCMDFSSLAWIFEVLDMAWIFQLEDTSP